MALTDDMEKQVNDIIDINLDGAERKKFRINGNNDAIIELNISDLGIVERVESSMEELQKYMSEIASLDTEEEGFSSRLKEIDQKMRDTVDAIFQYPVSAACAKYGTMYDPKNGKFRYETIIEGLMKLYNDNISEEYRKVQERLKKHTDKYTKTVAPTKRKKK